MLSIHKKSLNRGILIPKEEFEKILSILRKNEKLKVIEEDNFSDLLSASSDSLDFWNNKVDDEVWNDA